MTTPIDFTLKQITCPSYTPSSEIQIETYSSSNYRMSWDSSITFETGCTLPCRTCLSDDSASCLSCYDNEILVSGMTILDGTSCTSACGNGEYYDNSTNQCPRS